MISFVIGVSRRITDVESFESSMIFHPRHRLSMLFGFSRRVGEKVLRLSAHLDRFLMIVDNTSAEAPTAAENFQDLIESGKSQNIFVGS